MLSVKPEVVLNRLSMKRKALPTRKGTVWSSLGLSKATVLTMDLQKAFVPQLFIFKMGIMEPNVQYCEQD